MTARFQKLLEIVIVAMICYQQKSVSANGTLLAEECGRIKVDKIVNGKEASMGAYPWMTLIGVVRSTEIFWVCGGALITDRYILTAAHCVIQNREILQEMLDNGFARLGEHNVTANPDCSKEGECLPSHQDFYFEETIPHPFYNQDFQRNDICLIRLKGKVVFGPSVGTICLPEPNTDASEFLNGRNAVSAGWGITEGGHDSHVLMMVELPLNPIEKCQKLFVHVPPGQLCMGGTDDGKGLCYGDSGGPLFQIHPNNPRYVLLGVFSYGPMYCGQLYVPNVFTDVAYFMDFIIDNMAAYKQN